MNSALYCEVLLKLQNAVCRKRPDKLARGVSTASSSQCQTPYSPDLAPSDFQLFGPLKNCLGGRRFTDDKEVEMEVRKWLRQQPKDFCALGFYTLVK
jgi:hypothetical protein